MSATRTQAFDALDQANCVRIAHATIKLEVRSQGRVDGPLLVADWLESPSGHVPSMRIGHLLLAVSRVGPTQMTRWIRMAGIVSADKRVGDMTERQRLSLAEQLRSRVERWAA